MAAKASESKQGPKLKWLGGIFTEMWRERLAADMARPKFVPKPKRPRRAKKR